VYYSKIVLQYLGSDFAGFQWQKNAPTIQSTLNHALSQYLGCEFSTMGASRTDSGVHALEQFVRLTSREAPSYLEAKEKLNQLLPKSIRCLSFTSSTQLFRPALDSTSKAYSYLFTNKERASLEDRKLIANISNPLTLEPMLECLEMIKGTHDFRYFSSTGSNVKTSVRKVMNCSLKEINPHEFFSHHPLFVIPSSIERCYELQIEADGFLKQMIRHLVAGLWRVGSGRLSPSEFKNLLDSPHSQKQLWRVATPSGLYLRKINYPD